MKVQDTSAHIMRHDFGLFLSFATVLPSPPCPNILFFHISGCEHPPNFTVLGMIECEACRRRCGRAARESRGSTVPPSPT